MAETPMTGGAYTYRRVHQIVGEYIVAHIGYRPALQFQERDHHGSAQGMVIVFNIPKHRYSRGTAFRN